MTTATYFVLFIMMILFKNQVKTILQALAGLMTSISQSLIEAMKK